jgi:hypothetical protein
MGRTMKTRESKYFPVGGIKLRRLTSSTSVKSLPAFSINSTIVRDGCRAVADMVTSTVNGPIS